MRKGFSYSLTTALSLKYAFTNFAHKTQVNEDYFKPFRWQEKYCNICKAIKWFIILEFHTQTIVFKAPTTAQMAMPITYRQCRGAHQLHRVAQICSRKVNIFVLSIVGHNIKQCRSAALAYHIILQENGEQIVSRQRHNAVTDCKSACFQVLYCSISYQQ